MKNSLCQLVEIKILLFNWIPSQFYKVIPVLVIQDCVVLEAKVNAPHVEYNFEIYSFHFLTQAELNECKKL